MNLNPAPSVFVEHDQAFLGRHKLKLGMESLWGFLWNEFKIFSILTLRISQLRNACF